LSPSALNIGPLAAGSVDLALWHAGHALNTQSEEEAQAWVSAPAAENPNALITQSMAEIVPASILYARVKSTAY
jgi:hypothetical protein